MINRTWRQELQSVHGQQLDGVHETISVRVAHKGQKFGQKEADCDAD
jgi:hypothetical protein